MPRKSGGDEFYPGSIRRRTRGTNVELNSSCKNLIFSGVSKRKLLQRLLSGSRNIRFSDAVACVEAFGFRLARVSGSHHIFVHQEIPELVNLQNVKGKAKPYQIKQFLKLVERYNLRMENEE